MNPAAKKTLPKQQLKPDRRSTINLDSWLMLAKFKQKYQALALEEYPYFTRAQWEQERIKSLTIAEYWEWVYDKVIAEAATFKNE